MTPAGCRRLASISYKISGICRCTSCWTWTAPSTKPWMSRSVPGTRPSPTPGPSALRLPMLGLTPKQAIPLFDFSLFFPLFSLRSSLFRFFLVVLFVELVSSGPNPFAEWYRRDADNTTKIVLPPNNGLRNQTWAGGPIRPDVKFPPFLNTPLLLSLSLDSLYFCCVLFCVVVIVLTLSLG